MTGSKIYLNVPYNQKDAAKALGAKWDAANKKWYVPAGKDVTLFGQWQPQSVTLEPPLKSANQPKSGAASSNIKASANNADSGVTTHPTDKNFAAYNGDEPPWD